MAVSITTLEPVSGAKKFEDSNNANVPISVKGSAGVMHSITIDNSANVAVSYVKMWDLAVGSVTIGTTVPDWIIKMPASTKRTIPIPDGLAFATGLSVATTTTALLAGATSPASAVAIGIVHV